MVSWGQVNINCHCDSEKFLFMVGATYAYLDKPMVASWPVASFRCVSQETVDELLFPWFDRFDENEPSDCQPKASLWKEIKVLLSPNKTNSLFRKRKIAGGNREDTELRLAVSEWVNNDTIKFQWFMVLGLMLHGRRQSPHPYPLLGRPWAWALASLGKCH